MRILIAILLFASVTQLRADEAVAKAQQSLKDQGFYYGQVTGEKNADTSAAIRRFQIRNGLQVTGELNDETLQALRNAPPPSPPPVASVAPRTSPPATPDLRDDEAPESATPNTVPVEPFTAAPPNGPPAPIYPGRAVPSDASLFGGTPYEGAPPEVQRKVVIDAQRMLARRGLFKNQIDGNFGPDMEFSLRAYQSRMGLRPTGRLDLETLAALELLPGARGRIFGPRRGLRPPGEPPVRGEWIHP
jgi:peptidoglycan hydrolase-like protein with peptidoglycan-binding domain